MSHLQRVRSLSYDALSLWAALALAIAVPTFLAMSPESRVGGEAMHLVIHYFVVVFFISFYLIRKSIDAGGYVVDRVRTGLTDGREEAGGDE